MIKEIKFTDKAIKQINFLLNDKKKGFPSQLRLEVSAM